MFNLRFLLFSLDSSATHVVDRFFAPVAAAVTFNVFRVFIVFLDSYFNISCFKVTQFDSSSLHDWITTQLCTYSHGLRSIMIIFCHPFTGDDSSSCHYVGHVMTFSHSVGRDVYSIKVYVRRSRG